MEANFRQSILLEKKSIFNCADPDPYSDYGSGSISTQSLNTDTICFRNSPNFSSLRGGQKADQDPPKHSVFPFQPFNFPALAKPSFCSL